MYSFFPCFGFGSKANAMPPEQRGVKAKCAKASKFLALHGLILPCLYLSRWQFQR